MLDTIVCDICIYLKYSAQQGRETQFPEGLKTLIACSGSIIEKIQFSPDGKEFDVATNDEFWNFDARTGVEVALYTGQT